MGTTNGEEWLEGMWAVVKQRKDTLPIQEHRDERDFDESLAREMNRLSLKERERTFEEIHGVAQVWEETPERVAEKLRDMEVELQKIQQKAAYLKAWHRDREYVENPKFRLMFLRADRFDPAQAAARLVLFMEKKQQHFGEDTLTRSLQLSDLKADDLVTIKKGAMQVVPKRDRSGRLLCIDFSASEEKSYTSLMSVVSGYWRVWKSILSPLANDYLLFRRML